MLNSLLDLEEDNYEGVLFFGKVVDNNDPLKLERVRVEIAGLYEGDSTLFPWVMPIKHRKFGSKSGQGEFSVPSLNTYIAVMLQDGDPHYPYYVGSILVLGNTVSDFETNYPNRYGFKDPAGNLFYIDLTNGSQTVKFRHKSGLTFDIADSGRFTITGPEKLIANITGNVEMTVGGNVTADVTGNVAVTAQGTLSAVVTGNATLTAANVVITAATIALQNAGSALKKLVNDAFITLFNSHVHSGVQGGGSNTGTPTTTMGASHTTSVTQAE